MIHSLETPEQVTENILSLTDSEFCGCCHLQNLFGRIFSLRFFWKDV